MNFIVVESDFPFWRAFVINQWKRLPYRRLLLSQIPSLWPKEDYDGVKVLPLHDGRLDVDRLRKIADGFGPVCTGLYLLYP